VLVVMNVAVVFWGMSRDKPVSFESATQRGDVDCDKECVEEIVNAKVIDLVAVPTPTDEPEVVEATSKVTSKPAKEVFVRLSDGSGSSESWVNVGSGKWVDTALYGELLSATWEGWAEMPGGSGVVNIRLYDATNSRAVDGSEVMIKDTARTSFYSKSLTLWRGQNQYFVQVKTNGGGSVDVSEARMKLVVR